MKQLSKKERLKIQKRKEKRKRLLIGVGTTTVLILLIILWSMQASKDILKVENPIVSPEEVPLGQIHWHPKLEIIIEGQNIIIPNNIGLSPGKHSPTHTHAEGDGTIHLENSNPRAQPETMSLGFFFNEWGEPFNSTCILDKCTTSDGGNIRMYINNVENFDFENYIFKGEENILIEYTPN